MPPDPLILGIDTSSSTCSIALTRGPLVLASFVERMIRGQAERLFPLMSEALDGAGQSWQDLAAIGICTGPGNFTGIRLGVSAARGLSLSLGIPAVGVTMFEALTYGVDGPVLASVDARQDAVYLEICDGPHRSEPVVSPLDAIPDDMCARHPVCIGHESEKIACSLGTRRQDAPHSTPVAVALIASESYRRTTPKPAPLYVRTANAAPPRDAPPEILP